VVSDIEFATSWDNSGSRKKEPRFKGYEKLAPKGTADYAFILHSLYHLNDEGTMAMVLPHGVLFRGGVPGQSGAQAESFIRKNLINHPSGNKIYAVIGLPENIMFSEKGKKSVAVAIVVFKKKRDTDDILFIDASNEFDKGKNKNFLSSEHIVKIIKAYKSRSGAPKYAHLATKNEIELNEYNLNIPRYISNVEEEAEIDLEVVNQLLNVDDEEIAEVKAKINETLKVLGVRG
ncbi:MAG: SAM-dependent methyltransferase, partial [Lactococcus lactis]|nr:SAM-dependent methyltransferase [Lactococcus lactis]